MSKAGFERVMKVGKVLSGMKTLHDLLGEAPTLQLSDEGLERWLQLQREYDDFYALSLQERLEFSEMSKPPKSAGPEGDA
jgi:hypothetical protein